MFADNQRISHRQLKRQIVLSFGGVLLLFLSGEMAAGGRNAILGAFLGYGVLLLYFFFLVRNASAFSHLAETFDGVVKWLVFGIYASFLLLTGAYLLEQIGLVCSVFLLPDLNSEFLKVLILLTAVLGMGGDTQKRGRMGEAAFPWIFWGFVLLLVFAAFNMKVPDGGQLPALDGKSILWYGYRFFAVGCTISLFPFACARTEGKGSMFGGLSKCWFILTLLVVGAAIILLGTYGYPGVTKIEMPVLYLMSGTSLPGGFLERFDIIWMALLMLALLFSLGSILFYGVRIFLPRRKMDREKEHRISRRILAAGALLIWAATLFQYENITVGTVYTRLLAYFYAPLFVVITPLAGWGNRRLRHENKTDNIGDH